MTSHKKIKIGGQVAQVKAVWEILYILYWNASNHKGTYVMKHCTSSQAKIWSQGQTAWAQVDAIAQNNENWYTSW